MNISTNTNKITVNDNTISIYCNFWTIENNLFFYSEMKVYKCDFETKEKVLMYEEPNKRILEVGLKNNEICIVSFDEKKAEIVINVWDNNNYNISNVIPIQGFESCSSCTFYEKYILITLNNINDYEELLIIDCMKNKYKFIKFFHYNFDILEEKCMLIINKYVETDEFANKSLLIGISLNDLFKYEQVFYDIEDIIKTNDKKFEIKSSTTTAYELVSCRNDLLFFWEYNYSGENNIKKRFVSYDLSEGRFKLIFPYEKQNNVCQKLYDNKILFFTEKKVYFYTPIMSNVNCIYFVNAPFRIQNVGFINENLLYIEKIRNDEHVYCCTYDLASNNEKIILDYSMNDYKEYSFNLIIDVIFERLYFLVDCNDTIEIFRYNILNECLQ